MSDDVRDTLPLLTVDVDNLHAAAIKAFRPVPPAARKKKTSHRKSGPGATPPPKITLAIPDLHDMSLEYLVEAMTPLLNDMDDATSRLWPPFAVKKVHDGDPLLDRVGAQAGYLIFSVDAALERAHRSSGDKRTSPHEVLLGVTITGADGLLTATEIYAAKPGVARRGESLADKPDSIDARIWLLTTPEEQIACCKLHPTDQLTVDEVGALEWSTAELPPHTTAHLAEPLAVGDMHDAASSRYVGGAITRLNKRALGGAVPAQIASDALLQYFRTYCAWIATGERPAPPPALPDDERDAVARDGFHPYWTDLANSVGVPLDADDTRTISFHSHAASDFTASADVLKWLGPLMALEVIDISDSHIDRYLSRSVSQEAFVSGLWRGCAFAEAIAANPALAEEYATILRELFAGTPDDFALLLEGDCNSDEVRATWARRWMTVINSIFGYSRPGNHDPELWLDAGFPQWLVSGTRIRAACQAIDEDIATGGPPPPVVAAMAAALDVTRRREALTEAQFNAATAG